MSAEPSSRDDSPVETTPADAKPTRRRWFAAALFLVALIFAVVWYVRRPHPDEKLIPGSWLVQLSDGSRMLWVVNRDHRWTTWDVDASGKRTARSSGHWSFDGDTIVVREKLSGSSLLNVLFGQNSDDEKVYLDVESLQPDQIVTRYRTNGDRLEWNRQPSGVGP